MRTLEEIYADQDRAAVPLKAAKKKLAEMKAALDARIQEHFAAELAQIRRQEKEINRLVGAVDEYRIEAIEWLRAHPAGEEQQRI